MPFGRRSDMRILLVDDHLDTLSVFARVLRQRGHDVVTARDLSTARAVCEYGGFDFVICDLQLPDGDGCELAALAASYGTKAIALTGYGYPEDFERTKQAGFCAHLVKPVTVEKIELAMIS